MDVFLLMEEEAKARRYIYLSFSPSVSLSVSSLISPRLSVCLSSPISCHGSKLTRSHRNVFFVFFSPSSASFQKLCFAN